MTKGPNWEQCQVDEYLKRFNRDRAAVQAPNAKLARCAPAQAPAEAQEVHTRYRMHIHHRSKKLADATGRSHKAAVDGIVRGGILRDDNPKYLEGISESYEQSEFDQTIITLEPVKE